MDEHVVYLLVAVDTSEYLGEDDETPTPEEAIEIAMDEVTEALRDYGINASVSKAPQ